MPNLVHNNLQFTTLFDHDFENCKLQNLAHNNIQFAMFFGILLKNCRYMSKRSHNNLQFATFFGYDLENCEWKNLAHNNLQFARYPAHFHEIVKTCELYPPRQTMAFDGFPAISGQS